MNRCWNCGLVIPASLLLTRNVSEEHDQLESASGNPDAGNPDAGIADSHGAGDDHAGAARGRRSSDSPNATSDSDSASAIAEQPITATLQSEAEAIDSVSKTEQRASTETPPVDSIDEVPSRGKGHAGLARLEAAFVDETPGSPFAEPAVGKFLPKPTTAVYPQNIANVAGAGLALLLGVIALIEAPIFALGSLCTAVVGLLCGVWGIQSNRRVMSTIGMVLCTAALLWSSLVIAIESYIDQTGVNPLLPNTTVEPIEDDGKFGEF